MCDVLAGGSDWHQREKGLVSASFGMVCAPGGLGSLGGGSKKCETERSAISKTPRASHYLAITT